MYLEEIDISQLAYPSEWQNQLTVFHQKSLLALYAPYIHIIGIYHDDKKLIGTFYYFKKSKYGISYIIPPPFHPYNGLIFFPEAQSEHRKNSVFKNLQHLISEYLFKKEKATYIRFSLPPAYVDTQVFQWEKWKVNVHYTYQLSLHLSQDEILNNLSSEKRKSIRKAEKDGIMIVEENNYDVIIPLIYQTFHRQKKKINHTYIHKILKEWANETNSFAFVAYHHHQAIACTFCVYDSKSAYYLFGGYDTHKAHHGAGVNCMWHSILKSKTLQLKTFDFEGSMLPAVERYFRDFGGKMIPYYVCEKSKIPFYMP